MHENPVEGVSREAVTIQGITHGLRTLTLHIELRLRTCPVVLRCVNSHCCDCRLVMLIVTTAIFSSFLLAPHSLPDALLIVDTKFSVGKMVWANVNRFGTCVEGSKADVSKWSYLQKGNPNHQWKASASHGCESQGFTLFDTSENDVKGQIFFTK